MNTDDLIDFLSKFRLPLNREEKDTYNFLHQHLQNFENELAELLDEKEIENEFLKSIFDELKKRQKSICNFSQAILNSLQVHLDGDILNASRIFEDRMNEMQGSLLSSSMEIDLDSGALNRFFRIRPYREGEECKKNKDLFHIPFEKSHLAKSCRYSVPKSPHLYLSGSPSNTGLTLAWFETDCPSEFYWSEFILSNLQKKIELLDFTWSPFSNAMKAGNYRTWIFAQKPFIKGLLVNYVSTYPLIASCSIKAFDKNSQPEITEYIIPQMLLKWMGSNGKYRGIKYYSCSCFNEAIKYNAFNIVLPPKRETLSTGYCPRLKSELKVSKPKLMNVSDTKQLENINIETDPSEFEFIDNSCQEI